MDESDCATTIFYMFYASACLIDKAGIIFLFSGCPSVSELSTGPFRDPIQPNPTNYKWKKFGPNPTQPNTTNNGDYSLVVTYTELISYF